MRYPILSLAMALMLSSGTVRSDEPAKAPHFVQLTIQAEPQISTIDIESYTLITSNVQSDRGDAAEIMRVKADWPRAMQEKSKPLFESILARDFTFRAEGQFFARDAYIRDRVESVETVEQVRYENLVLQLFGSTAVLTYRNIVSGADGATGLPETWHYSWADVFVREDGRWKISGSHLISERLEANR